MFGFRIIMIMIMIASARRSEEFFLNTQANAQRVKRDIFTADIYYYIKTEFYYPKQHIEVLCYNCLNL